LALTPALISAGAHAPSAGALVPVAPVCADVGDAMLTIALTHIIADVVTGAGAVAPVLALHGVGAGAGANSLVHDPALTLAAAGVGAAGAGAGDGKANYDECKLFLPPSRPADVMEVQESKVTHWSHYDNLISRYWCFVIDPARGNNIFLMVSRSGGNRNGGMVWVGQILTRAFYQDFWQGLQIDESEYPLVMPFRSNDVRHGLVHLDPSKMLEAQVRAPTGEYVEYKQKLFDCAGSTMPDYHLVRPFFHYMLENVTDMPDRTQLIREFLESWPHNVRV
jgi:hypothetical protein